MMVDLIFPMGFGDDGKSRLLVAADEVVVEIVSCVVDESCSVRRDIFDAVFVPGV